MNNLSRFRFRYRLIQEIGIGFDFKKSFIFDFIFNNGDEIIKEKDC